MTEPNENTLPTVIEAGLPAELGELAETARAYARAGRAPNTQRAYASDWRHFTGWCRRHNRAIHPADPATVGLYLTSSVTPSAGGGRTSVATLERRLSALVWNYKQRGEVLDRRDPHISEVIAGIRRQHARPPVGKEAVMGSDILAMLGTLPHDLRGLRDRAILLVGFAGGLRRSEIVGLDSGPDQTEDGTGWIEIEARGLILTVRGKRGWREIEIGRGSGDLTCPVAALQTWLKLGRIGKGPVFRAVSRGGTVGEDRLNDRHIARLVKSTALAAGVRADLSEGKREAMFAGHSLRAGLASSAEIEERYVQKQLGHSSAEMTRRYQRQRDRFKVNLTKAAGL